jgi:hypothetical protein
MQPATRVAGHSTESGEQAALPDEPECVDGPDGAANAEGDPFRPTGPCASRDYTEAIARSRSASDLHGTLQHFRGPLIEALARRLSDDDRVAMNLGRNSKQQLARGRLLGLEAQLLALAHVVLGGLLELRAQFAHRLAVKADDAADAKDATGKEVVSLVKLDAGCVALVRQRVQGCTPILSRSSRACST